MKRSKLFFVSIASAAISFVLVENINGREISAVALPAATIDEGTTGPLTWNFTDDGTLTISGKGEMPDYVFYTGSNRDTSSPWTQYKSKVKKIVISEGVTSIGNWAFGCSEVQLITGVYAGVNEITLPKSLTRIGKCAFSGCSTVEEIEIPAGVTHIGWRAFFECNGLTRIKIPADVTTIEDQAFGACKRLVGIDVAARNRNYSSVKGVLFDKNKTMLVAYPCGLIGNYDIPQSVTSIGAGVFQLAMNLTGVTIPDGVKNIELLDFHNCDTLSDVTVMAVTPPLVEASFSFLSFTAKGDTLHVPAGCVDAYKADPEWSKAFTNIVEQQ